MELGRKFLAEGEAKSIAFFQVKFIGCKSLQISGPGWSSICYLASAAFAMGLTVRVDAAGGSLLLSADGAAENRGLPEVEEDEVASSTAT